MKCPPCVKRDQAADRLVHELQPLSPPCLAAAEATEWGSTDHSSASPLALPGALHLLLASLCHCSRQTVTAARQELKDCNDQAAAIACP